MPKFKTARGMPTPRLITQIGDELHIDNRVYRVSDLSEIIGRQSLPRQDYAQPANSTFGWTIRAKRGYMAANRITPVGSSVSYYMADFDIMLCGVWKNASIAGFEVDANNFRNSVVGPNASGLMSDYNKVSAAVLNVLSANNLWSNSAIAGWNDSFVALSQHPSGRLLMTAYGASNSIAGSIEALPKNTPITGNATIIHGYRTAAGAQYMPRRIFENELRSFILSTYVGYGVAATQYQAARIAHDTLATAVINSSIAAPVGAAAIGSGSGYCNSGPSYAIESDVDELSSYIAYRHTNGIEIHRAQFNALAGTTTVSNNLVALDSNPMLPHGVSSHNTGIRCVVSKLPNGEQYLLVLSVDNSGAPTPNTSKLYCYKIVSKNSLQYVGTSQLAVSPRNYLGASDDWTRFIVAYDDRYEMWTVGAGGVLSLAETVTVSRYSATHYHAADPYGFDSVGRFWYITPDSTTPTLFSELGLNFIAPPGAVNTIKLELEQDIYDFNGTPVPGNVSVSVQDINGNYLATTVKLNGSANVVFGNDTVTTLTTGPLLVPFSLVAPGELIIGGDTV